LTAPPSTLVVRLYETAIRELTLAVRCIEANDVRGRFASNSKAVEIIEHLYNTLDFEKGGQIAANLGQLYRFMMRRLIDVDIKNDAQPAKDVIGLLTPLLEAWRRLDAQVAGKTVQGSAETGTPSNPPQGICSVA